MLRVRSIGPRRIGVGYAPLPVRFDIYLNTPIQVREQMVTFADELHRAVAELDEPPSGGEQQ